MVTALVVAIDPMVRATDDLVWATFALAVITAGSVGVSIVLARGDRAAARRERLAAQDTQRIAALRALQAELRMNIDLTKEKEVAGVSPNESSRNADIDKTFVPFQRDALVAALPYLSSLPPDTVACIQRANVAVLRYNTLAPTIQQHLTRDEFILAALDGARPALTEASVALEQYLASQEQGE